jgi:hypothetical protein
MSKTQIVTGGIADDAVSEEHLDATAITGSTELAATPADTDEILISDGGVLKRIDYSHIKTAAGFTKIHSIDASNSSNVNFDNNYVTSTYRTYLLICDGINNNSDDTNFRLKLSTDNGSSFLSGISRVHVSVEDDDSSVTITNNDEGASTASIGSRGQGNATGEHGSGAIFIYGSQDSNSWININAQYVSWGNGMELTWEDSVHGARSTDALNYIRAEMSSGVMTTGRFTLYGAN